MKYYLFIDQTPAVLGTAELSEDWQRMAQELADDGGDVVMVILGSVQGRFRPAQAANEPVKDAEVRP